MVIFIINLVIVGRKGGYYLKDFVWLILWLKVTAQWSVFEEMSLVKFDILGFHQSCDQN